MYDWCKVSVVISLFPEYLFLIKKCVVCSYVTVLCLFVGLKTKQNPLWEPLYSGVDWGRWTKVPVNHFSCWWPSNGNTLFHRMSQSAQWSSFASFVLKIHFNREERRYNTYLCSTVCVCVCVFFRVHFSSIWFFPIPALV